MQDSRRATIYPTAQGWFLELPETGSDSQDVYAYGPVNTAFEANWYLRTVANPGTVVVSHDLRAVPASSPNGFPVVAIKQPTPSPVFAETVARFITHSDLFYTFIYDSLCDIGYEIDGDRVTAIRPGAFWSPQTEILPKSLARPVDEAGWKALARSTAAQLLGEGRTYEPVRIDGLSYRPALVEYIREWAISSS